MPNHFDFKSSFPRWQCFREVELLSEHCSLANNRVLFLYFIFMLYSQSRVRDGVVFGVKVSIQAYCSCFVGMQFPVGSGLTTLISGEIHSSHVCFGWCILSKARFLLFFYLVFSSLPFPSQ